MRQQGEQLDTRPFNTRNEYLETPRFRCEFKGCTGKLGGSKYHTIHVTKYSSQVEKIKHHHHPIHTEIKDKKVLKHFAREGLNLNSVVAQ